MLINSLSSRSVVMTWDPPQDRTQRDGTVVQYRVRCDSVNSVIASMEVVSNSTSLTNLLPHHKYSCCVSVETTNGKSLFTCQTFTTLEEGMHVKLNDGMVLLLLP